MNIFKSRTVWTLVFMFAFNGWNAIAISVDPSLALVINAIFTTVAAYFKLNPSQKY